MLTPDELITNFGLQPLTKVALTRLQIEAIQADARKDLLEKIESLNEQLIHADAAVTYHYNKRLENE